MNIFDQNHDFYNQPIRLSEEQKKDPLKIIEDFFVDFHLIDTRIYLAEWLECALLTENSQFAGARQRNSIHAFSERIEDLLEAAYLLKDSKIKKEDPLH